MTPFKWFLYIAAAICIVLAVPAAEWFSGVVGTWMGVE